MRYKHTLANVTNEIEAQSHPVSAAARSIRKWRWDSWEICDSVRIVDRGVKRPQTNKICIDLSCQLALQTFDTHKRKPERGPTTTTNINTYIQLQWQYLHRACSDVLIESLVVLNCRKRCNLEKVKVLSPKIKSVYFSVSRTKGRFRYINSTYIILLSVPS